jgi:hypothetical protein
MYITDFTIGDELATIPDYNAKNNDSCEIDQFLFLD